MRLVGYFTEEVIPRQADGNSENYNRCEPGIEFAGNAHASEHTAAPCDNADCGDNRQSDGHLPYYAHAVAGGRCAGVAGFNLAMASDEEDRRYLERSMRRFGILVRDADAREVEDSDRPADEEVEVSRSDEEAMSGGADGREAGGGRPAGLFPPAVRVEDESLIFLQRLASGVDLTEVYSP